MCSNAGMARVIAIVNRLQDAFAATGLPFGIELPQIAVVGGQSAGKSSVLENFVGRDFLPRGSGIVTRQPLILQLKHSNTQEYGEFQHLAGKKFTNFDDVRREIENETNRVTGGYKGISNQPINLRICSPNVLNLTLVDLPGMTQVPVGDQPPDIDEQIRNMVLEYVKQENTLILAVSPANADLATSDALRIVRQVDPEGHRTIGVITKLDLMDAGTDAREILENKVLPLKRGYIGVVNRSQDDINNHKSIEAAMDTEANFFRTHPSYRHLEKTNGTPHLQQVLNRELVRHIQEKLPGIRTKLRNQMTTMKKQLGDLPSGDDRNWKSMLMMQIIQEFVTQIQKELWGVGLTVDVMDLGAGARINQTFYAEFQQELTLSQIPQHILNREISMAIRNCHAVRNGLFTPDKAFTTTVINLVLRYKDPIHSCVERIVRIMHDVTERHAQKMSLYPHLMEEVNVLIAEKIQKQEDYTKKALMDHVDSESSFLNTRHQDFIGKPTDWANKSADDATPAEEGNPSGETAPPNQQSPGTAPDQAAPKSRLQRSPSTVSQGSTRTTRSNDTPPIHPIEAPINKGWLLVHMGAFRGGMKELWFVLTRQMLYWFRTDEETDKVGELSLREGFVRAQETHNGPWSKDHKFILIRTDGKQVFENKRDMAVSFRDKDSYMKWRASLIQVGVICDVQATQDNGFDQDFVMEVAIIKTMVESYMAIVSKTIRDLVPKYVTHHLVDATVQYIETGMVSQLATRDDHEILMETNHEEAARQEELRRNYKAAEEALKIIGDIEF